MLRLNVLLLTLLSLTASQAVAQQAEPFDAARIPRKQLRLEQPETGAPPARLKELGAGITDDRTYRTFYFAPKIVTVFPLFLGAGVEASYRNKLALGLSYGFTPKPYSQAIAEAASSLANEPDYKPAIEAAFKNNSVLRGYLEYRTRNGDNGFQFGTAVSHLSANGSAPIDEVLESPTGILYTVLKALLAAEGKEANVNMKSKLMLAEIYAGYGWSLTRNLTFALDLGLAKVFASDINLKTEIESYDSSADGSAQLRESESDLEKIIRDNGFTPTLGLKLGYTF